MLSDTASNVWCRIVKMLGMQWSVPRTDKKISHCQRSPSGWLPFRRMWHMILPWTQNPAGERNIINTIKTGAVTLLTWNKATQEQKDQMNISLFQWNITQHIFSHRSSPNNPKSLCAQETLEDDNTIKKLFCSKHFLKRNLSGETLSRSSERILFLDWPCTVNDSGRCHFNQRLFCNHCDWLQVNFANRQVKKP